MNTVIIGADKAPILEHVPSGNFLFIDDGPLIDALELPARRKVTHFDVSKHRLNPLHDVDYRRAREFVSVMGAIFPEGADTLTKKNADFVLLNALLHNPPLYLGKLLRPDKKDPAKQDAYQKIETLLLSPVLRSVLCGPTNFSLRGIVLARLDRAVLGDFDAFVLASLLISQFKGQVIIPDGGFYLRGHHIALARQDRLIVGVNNLSELTPELRQAVLLFENKEGKGCSWDDACVLARCAGLVPQTVAHGDFVARVMSQ